MLWCLTPTLSIISFVWPNQVERKHDGDWKDFLAICASLPAPQQIKDWTGKSKRGKNILTLNRSFSPELGGPLLCWVCSTTLLYLLSFSFWICFVLFFCTSSMTYDFKTNFDSKVFNHVFYITHFSVYLNLSSYIGSLVFVL